MNKKIKWQSDKIRDCADLLGCINLHILFGNYDTIDIMLSTIDLESVSELIMIGFLRYTFMAHMHTPHSLPSWLTVHDNIHEELIRRGLDADDLLRGLHKL